MIYRIDIWKNHSKVATYSSESPVDLIYWFGKNWKNTDDEGYCCHYIFEDEIELSVEDSVKFFYKYDIDEELLIKAVISGIYKKEFNKITKIKCPVLRNIDGVLCLQEQKFVANKCVHFELPDYGRTWALTMEELV